jgi:hypothetical protein
MRQVPPVVVSNSEKSSCQTWFAPVGSVANAALRACGEQAAFALVGRGQDQCLVAQQPQDRGLGDPVAVVAAHRPDLAVPPGRVRERVPAGGVLDALAGRTRPRALAASRSTVPKYPSASRGSISHNGRPNQARTCPTCITSEATVPSASPAAERASTNPARTSVSSATRSSGVTGARTSRRSRTAASPNPNPHDFSKPARRTAQTVDLQESRDNFRCWKRREERVSAQVQGLWRP